MGVVIRNALLVDIDPLQARPGELRVDGERIAAVGPTVTAAAGDEVVDAGGAVVMPGLVNGHAHLYSALAVGMPPPPKPPQSFQQILEYVWWRLDRALDLESVEVSATVGALDALRCGTTTLIDHHASPNAIEGSLEAIERGLGRVGLRGVLCYETTDRNGRAGREAGLAENERYLARCARRHDGRFAGMVGGHAAFTLDDEALAAAAKLARRYGVGVHIHVAEDPSDDELCRRKHGVGALERLERAGVLALPSILAHGTHLSEVGLARVKASPVMIAHNPRSNMNNAVGYASGVIAMLGPQAPAGASGSDPSDSTHPPQAPLGKGGSGGVVLGTDGIGSDMLAELQAAWFKSRDARAGLTPADCVRMLAASARRAGESLGVTLGRFEAGAAADIVVTDYIPATPLTTENAAGHLIFGMSNRQVRSVLVGGEWRLRDRQVAGMDESAFRCSASIEASRLYGRMPGSR